MRPSRRCATSPATTGTCRPSAATSCRSLRDESPVGATKEVGSPRTPRTRSPIATHSGPDGAPRPGPRATRIRAASDRERAARDRARAARDRGEAAAKSAEQAVGTASILPCLARRRGVGLEELENEVKRARRERHPPRSRLHRRGWAQGGQRPPRATPPATPSSGALRGASGGTCAPMTSWFAWEVTSSCARCPRFRPRRQAHGSATSARPQRLPGNSVSIGFGELRESDSADALVQRADSDLLSRRGHPPRPPPRS